MAAGGLIAVYAYEVSPRQMTALAGGAVAPTERLQAALDAAFDRSKLLSAPPVTLEVDATATTRSHPIRDAALVIAFSPGSHESVVASLAQRLADAMDNRSKPCLFMVSVHSMPNLGERRLLLWTFPQQVVFTLRTRDGATSLDLLEAFNRESSLRKAALLEGANTRTGLLTARVLDLQSSANERTVADLWIVKFLAARLQMSDAEGTRLLARALRAAHTKTRDDRQAQDQIIAAIGALRVTQTPRWSIESVATTYLGEAAATALTDAVRPEERAVPFGIQTDTLDQLIQYQRFVLDNGVVVSAPFVEIGGDGGVQVTVRDGRRRLRAEGEIEEEQVRSRV